MQSAIAYVSFDAVPAPKGASTHIQAFAKALAEHFGGVDLATVSEAAEISGPVERWPGVWHYELPAKGATLIDRVLCFRRWLGWWLGQRRYDFIQFRSIFEGAPLLKLNPRPRLIFEVNGLGSIELKYRYPAAADDRELMGKIAAQENACLRGADRIVTPSGVTRSYLCSVRGAGDAKIRVVPNGVDTELFRPYAGPHERRLAYFGTLAGWQGVETAIRALHQVRTAAEFDLTVIGPGDAKALAALAGKLGIGERVEFAGALPQAEVAEHVRRSFAVLAPLAMNDRNVVQGCCPLKVLEGMACGVPVIASDLPVVRELGEDGRQLILVKPGSVDRMAEAILGLTAETRRSIGEAARARVLERFTWKIAGDALARVYRELQ